MPPKKNTFDAEQSELFTRQDAMFLSEPIRPGAAVSVYERADNLAKVLKMFNEDSQAAGLAQAGSGNPNRRRLEERYGDATDRVVGGASQKAAERQTTEKFLFSIASGQWALERAAYDPIGVRATIADSYKEFTKEFGVGNADAKKRNKQAKKLQKVAHHITGRHRN